MCARAYVHKLYSVEKAAKKEARHTRVQLLAHAYTKLFEALGQANWVGELAVVHSMLSHSFEIGITAVSLLQEQADAICITTYTPSIVLLRAAATTCGGLE